MCIPTFSLPSDCLHHKHLYLSPSALPDPLHAAPSSPIPTLPRAPPKGESVKGGVHTAHGSCRDQFLARQWECPTDSTQLPACATCGPLLSSTCLINLTEIKLQVTSWEWEDDLMCSQTVICWSLSNLQIFKKASKRGNHHLKSDPHLLSFMLLPSQDTFTSGALISCPALLLPHTHVGDKLHSSDTEIPLRVSLGAQCHRPHPWGHREKSLSDGWHPCKKWCFSLCSFPNQCCSH